MGRKWKEVRMLGSHMSHPVSAAQLRHRRGLYLMFTSEQWVWVSCITHTYTHGFRSLNSTRRFHVSHAQTHSKKHSIYNI